VVVVVVCKIKSTLVLKERERERCASVRASLGLPFLYDDFGVVVHGQGKKIFSFCVPLQFFLWGICVCSVAYM
jgi:hypothetical protein